MGLKKDLETIAALPEPSRRNNAEWEEADRREWIRENMERVDPRVDAMLTQISAKECVRRYLRSYANLRMAEEMNTKQLAIAAIGLSRDVGAPTDDLLIAVAELLDRFD